MDKDDKFKGGLTCLIDFIIKSKKLKGCKEINPNFLKRLRTSETLLRNGSSEDES
jgi:hypothetical protein